MTHATALRHPHITEELHRRVRPGKMGPVVRICIWTALLVCGISGLVQYWQTDWALSFKPLGRWPLVLHGMSGMALAIGLGMLMQSHIRAAWRMKKHRISGGLMVSLMTLLIVSGLLLYYGSPNVIELDRSVHLVFGLLFIVLAVWHGLLHRLRRHQG